MRIPLDQICVKTGVLCPRCQALIDEGVYEPFEVDLMRTLLDLEKEIKELSSATYEKAYQIDNLVVLVLKWPDYDPELLRRLRQALQRKLERKKVRVVVSNAEPKEMAAMLLLPVTVKGVNIVWMPDGSQKYVVRVSQREMRKLPAPKEQLEKILSKLFDSEVVIRPE